MHQAYCNIFDRINLDYRPVQADSGSIGGAHSHEFHVLADSGEDDIAFSDSSDYAANIELAEAMMPDLTLEAKESLEEFATPNVKTIEELCQFSNCQIEQTLKTLIVLGISENQNTEIQDPDTAPLIALVLRGDHELNELKAEKITGIMQPLTLASEQRIKNELGLSVGSIGPKDLNIRTIVDRSASKVSDFYCGANKEGFHLKGVNWQRDLKLGEVADIRNVVAGDPSPCGNGVLSIKRGIEVGHIFQLGEKYSQALNASVLDENGKAKIVTMGCYGIGVTRVVAAAIEQNHDSKGILWPESIAPFQIAIIPINYHKSETVKSYCESIYNSLINLGYEAIIFDEEKARLGAMLADVELMGIPHRLVIGDKGLEKGTVEYKNRRQTENQDLDKEKALEILEKNLGN